MSGVGGWGGDRHPGTPATRASPLGAVLHFLWRRSIQFYLPMRQPLPIQAVFLLLSLSARPPVTPQPKLSRIVLVIVIQAPRYKYYSKPWLWKLVTTKLFDSLSAPAGLILCSVSCLSLRWPLRLRGCARHLATVSPAPLPSKYAPCKNLEYSLVVASPVKV